MLKTKFDNGMEVHRLGAVPMHLSHMYAPEEGWYIVHSQINTIWVDGYLCVMGYVVEVNGKLQRFWMQ